MKIISLIKAVFTEDMSLFKVNINKDKKISKLLLPIILFVLVSFSIGSYAFMIAEVLHKFNLTYIMISMFIIFVTIITFIEGIYKSQGILFNSKDEGLLFSLPIKKSQILFVRILKLNVFQYIYNLMFLLPAFIVYIYFEKPGIIFYLLSILMSFLVPIIPTILSSIIGYFIKVLSSKVKSKKIIETIFSFLILVPIFFISFNIETFVANLGENAKSINEILIKLYYPIGVYNKLIINFNILDLIKLILINVIPLILFILFGSKYYFKIIFKTKENYVKTKTNTREKIYIKRSKMNTLIRKEFKRYLSSPIYIVNTSFGLILSLVGSIMFIFNDSILESIELLKQSGIDLPIGIIFYIFMIFVISMTQITASSISLEGKTIDITKSLPIGEKEILKSKLYFSFILELPFLIISYIIFIIKFRINLLHSLFIIILIFTLALFVSSFGLIINIKYPKMNAKNDTEIVKQSMSVMIATFTGLGIFIGSIILIIYLTKYLDINLIILIHLLVITILSITNYIYLMKKGSIEYRKINV